MIDGIKAYCRSREAHDQLLLNNKQGLVFAGKVKTGDIREYQGEYAGLYVNVFEPTKESLEPGIYLHGSLHRYLKGRNDGLFTFEHLTEAVNNLAIDFYVDPSQCDLQNVEFGVNIETKSPEALINSAILYHGKTGIRNPGKKFFGKCWEFSQYSIKLYKKGPHLVRYEIKIREMAKVGDIHLNSISDLCDTAKYTKLLLVLLTSVDEFLFVPLDREYKLPVKESAVWGIYRAESYWEELDKDKKYRASRKIKDLIEKYGLISWSNYLKKKTIEEGGKTLGTSPEELCAILSALGLHAQTVADPIGESDRQANLITASIKTILVPVHYVVRNTWCTVDVIISVPSYHPLMPRGPPSSSVVFLCMNTTLPC